eukprot:17667-Heterococcus_DN1.PRE.6
MNGYTFDGYTFDRCTVKCFDLKGHTYYGPQRHACKHCMAVPALKWSAACCMCHTSCKLQLCTVCAELQYTATIACTVSLELGTGTTKYAIGVATTHALMQDACAERIHMHMHERTVRTHLSCNYLEHCSVLCTSKHASSTIAVLVEAGALHCAASMRVCRSICCAVVCMLALCSSALQRTCAYYVLSGVGKKRAAPKDRTAHVWATSASDIWVVFVLQH